MWIVGQREAERERERASESEKERERASEQDATCVWEREGKAKRLSNYE